jgi:predicted  nucleic acid-binding Zn-ribbon protein
VSFKEIRQKEMKLKKKEDEIKKSKAEIEDCSKDNHRLKSYSLKLEAQVKELENSNRILRMKVVGSDDAVVVKMTG